MERFIRTLWVMVILVTGTFSQNVTEIELKPFSSLAHGLRSGPIFIVNETTFYITNLHYDGRGPDAHFWAGKGKQGPNAKGVLVPDENNSKESVKAYKGQDVYITLPEGLTIHMIDYIGMWCIKFSQNFGYTLIATDRTSGVMMNNPRIDSKGNTIIRYPKCCPLGTVKTSSGCIKQTVEVPPMNVYDGNMTFFDDEPLTNITLIPYRYEPPCPYKMFALDPNEAFYLKNGVILCDNGEILTKDSFCIDIHEDVDENEQHLSWAQTVFVCFKESHVPDFLNILFAVCIYISAFFLIITSLIFIFVRDARNTRGFNVVGYTIFMALSFIILATARVLHVTGTKCVVFGFIYQFLLIASFTWLFCLTYETYHRVRNYDKPHMRKRFYIYTGCSIGLPLVAVIISILVDKTLPQKFSSPTPLGYEPCWFRSDKKVVFYYIPIGTSILLNVFFAVRTWRMIKFADKRGNHNWGIVDKNLKNVFRSCYLLLIIMSICWAAEIVSHFFETKNGFWIAIDIINSLQGFFVFMIFIMHNPVIDILQRRFPKLFKPIPEPVESETKLFRPPIEVPIQHLEVLSNNRRCDSEENLNNL